MRFRWAREMLGRLVGTATRSGRGSKVKISGPEPRRGAGLLAAGTRLGDGSTVMVGTQL